LLADEDVHGIRGTEGLAVDAWRDQGVVDVADREDSGVEVELRSRQLVRVTAAVEPLVVRADQLA
jgi:hypothetical protein